MLIGQALTEYLKIEFPNEVFFLNVSSTNKFYVGITQEMSSDKPNLQEGFLTSDFQISVRDIDQLNGYERAKEIFKALTYKYNIVQDNIQIILTQPTSDIFYLGEVEGQIHEVGFDLTVKYYNEEL